MEEIEGLDKFTQHLLANGLDEGDVEFLDFANDVLFDFMKQEPSEFVPLGDMHKEWWNTINSDLFYTGIICARGHLKTTFNLCYCAYMMHKYPNFRALYVSATLDQAIDKMEQFEELCRRSWRLNGHIKGRKDSGSWRKSAKYFRNGSRVRAASIGKALEGPHVHLIIMDDVLEEFARNSDAKVIHYIKRVVMPMRLPEGQILLIGTQKRVGDATDWIRQSSDWSHVWHPALTEEGTPRWPEYWTLDRLEAERHSMGSRAFESEYMLNPLDPDTAVIPWEVIQPCLDSTIGFEQPLEDSDIVIGVDLAVGLDAQNDETAYCVVAYDRTTKIRQVIYQWTGKVQAEGAGWLRSQVDNITSLAEKYKPTIIMIETNGFQRLVAHAAKDMRGLPVKGHRTGSEKHHAAIGIPRIALAMEQNRYIIPWNKSVNKSGPMGSRKLVEGLSRLMWGENGRLDGHTADSVVSLWMCELAIEEIDKRGIRITSWDNSIL
ncbi:MAG: hypothetical protein CML17_08505 [Pusillimonas sp.]|nr:hypothetical protein [Pusillimonas sp.]